MSLPIFHLSLFLFVFYGFLSFFDFLFLSQLTGGASGLMALRTGPVRGYDFDREVVSWTAAGAAVVAPAALVAGDAAAAAGRTCEATAASHLPHTEAYYQAFALHRRIAGASFAWVAPCYRKALLLLAVSFQDTHMAYLVVGVAVHSHIVLQR